MGYQGRNDGGYTAPHQPSELDSIEAALDSFAASSEELRQETRAGGGTPVERRIADTFVDMNTVFRQMNDKLDSVGDELRRIHSTPETVQRSIADYLATNGQAITSMNERAERAIGSIESLDTTIGDKYKEAVDESVKRIRSATAACIGLMVLACVCCLAAVWVWTWHEYSFMPWIHELMQTYGIVAIAFWVVLIGLVLAGVWYVLSKTKERLEKRY